MEMLNEMAIFARVVESGSFSASARQLGVNTSAISRHITRLEAHMGGRLLQRTTRSFSLTELGQDMLTAAEVLFWVTFGVTVVLAIASLPVYVGGFFLWGFGNYNFFTQVSEFLQRYFLPLLYVVLAYLIIVGGLLGVYIPLIPYTLFMFGVIGWFLAVIDAMVAAPLVAIGIMAPGGRSDILGRAEPGLMIMLNVFLRPTLMIFGVMTSMLLSYVVIVIINSAFFNTIYTIHSSMGIIEAFIYIQS